MDDLARTRCIRVLGDIRPRNRGVGRWFLLGIGGGVRLRVVLVLGGWRVGGIGRTRGLRFENCGGACGSKFLILRDWFYGLNRGCRLGVQVLSSGWLERRGDFGRGLVLFSKCSW